MASLARRTSEKVNTQIQREIYMTYIILRIPIQCSTSLIIMNSIYCPYSTFGIINY